MKRYLLITLFFTLFYCGNSFAKKFTIDTAHTKVGFNVTHLVFNTMEGQFKSFKGTFDYDDGSGVLKDVNVEISSKSIDTNHSKRDKHLKSPDFFDVKKYPSLTYQIKEAKVKIGEEVIVKGTLELRGVKKEVPMRLTLMGPVSDPWGNSFLVFKLWGSIDREEFGMTWNETLKGNVQGMLIGKVVDIKISGEAK